MADDSGLALKKRLQRLAGYTQDGVQPKGGAYAEEYTQVLMALEYVGNRKVDDYGDFRLQDIRSWEREVWGAYWDIQRKFGRLETQSLSRSTASVDQLMESLADMAVYCVRMIQILRRLEEKGMVPHERLDHRNG